MSQFQEKGKPQNLVHISVLLVAGAVVVTSPPPLQARQRGPRRPSVSQQALKKARSHYRRGIKLFQDEEFKPALAEFLASNKFRSHWRTLYNIATCYGRLGDYVTAIRYYRKTLKHKPAPPWEKRRSVAREIKRLRSLLAIVRIGLNVPKATLQVSGTKRQITNGQRIRLPSGVHVLVVKAPGFSSVRQKVTLTGGSVSSVQFTLRRGTKLRVVSNRTGARVLINGVQVGTTPYKADVAPRKLDLRVERTGSLPWQGQVSGKPGATVVVDVNLDDPKKGMKQYWFWAAAGTALALGATALGLGLHTKSLQKDYDTVVRQIQGGSPTQTELEALQSEGRALQSDLRRFSTGANVAIGLSAVSAAAAVALAFFTRFRAPKSRASISLAIRPDGGAGIVAMGRF